MLRPRPVGRRALRLAALLVLALQPLLAAAVPAQSAPGTELAAAKLEETERNTRVKELERQLNVLRQVLDGHWIDAGECVFDHC